SVVLPAPLGPTRACTVPAGTVRSTPSTARKPRKSLHSPRVCRAGGGMGLLKTWERTASRVRSPTTRTVAVVACHTPASVTRSEPVPPAELQVEPSAHDRDQRQHDE